jgi:hypothetical protein
MSDMDKQGNESMNYTDDSGDKQLAVDEQGNNWVYPSGAASGHVQITLPAAHGNPEEQLLIKDFGGHVAREVERSLAPNLYPKASPRKSATVTFRHYLGAAQGAQLLDPAGLKRMADLASEFESVPGQKEYFEMVVKPWLVTLTPRRR